MASIKTKLAVGIFVIIGFGVVLVAVMWLGMASQFKKADLYAAYFDESVQGLSKDSPVKYRGVSVGRVERLGVAPDDTLIEVILAMNPDLQLGPEMVAQLKSVGITGIMFVELDKRKPEDPDLAPVLTFPSRYPVIATRPSKLEELIGGISDIVHTIQLLDFKGISEEIKQTVARIRRAVDDARIDDLSVDARRTLGQFDIAMAEIKTAGAAFRLLVEKSGRTVDGVDRTLVRADRFIDTTQSELTGVYEGLKESLRSADAQLETLTTELAGLSTHTDQRVADVQERLVLILQQMEIAAINLNRFTDLIASQPSQLVFGGPPPPRPLSGGSTPDGDR